MGDSFFDAFDDKIEANWDEVTDERVQALFKNLSDQDAERIFDEMKSAIAANNKRKSIISVSCVVLQEVVKLGLKSLG